MGTKLLTWYQACSHSPLFGRFFWLGNGEVSGSRDQAYVRHVTAINERYLGVSTPINERYLGVSTPINEGYLGVSTPINEGYLGVFSLHDAF